MADKPQTFIERLRVDIGAVSSQWQQMQATARSALAPRGSSTPRDANDTRLVALDIRQLQGEMFKLAEMYQHMSQTLVSLEKRAKSLAEIHGLEVNADDYKPATGPVKEAVFKELPADKIELFDPYNPLGSSNPENIEATEW